MNPVNELNYKYKTFVIISYDVNTFEKKINDLLELVYQDVKATLHDIKYQFTIEENIEVYSAMVITKLI